METWGNPITVSNGAADGDLKQLYPDWATAGTGATTAGTKRRIPTEGTLYHCQVFPSSAQGGIFELWDIGGEPEGATNNTDTGTAITDAYLQAKIARNKAKLIWRIGFKGDDGLTTKTWWQKIPVTHGLAARFINTDVGAGTANITLSIAASGCYRKIQICGA